MLEGLGEGPCGVDVGSTWPVWHARGPGGSGRVVLGPLTMFVSLRDSSWAIWRRRALFSMLVGLGKGVGPCGVVGSRGPFGTLVGLGEGTGPFHGRFESLLALGPVGGFSGVHTGHFACQWAWGSVVLGPSAVLVQLVAPFHVWLCGFARIRRLGCWCSPFRGLVEVMVVGVGGESVGGRHGVLVITIGSGLTQPVNQKSVATWLFTR
jgi:hypothetical protein